MIKFKRSIIILRFILLFFLVLISATILLELFSQDLFNNLSSRGNLFKLIIIFFLIFTILRLIRIIFSESVDIELNDKFIKIHNILTRKTQTYNHKNISGYKVEKYKWNIIKISGLSSMWNFESKKLVIYSRFKALYHFKSINYFGLEKFTELLKQYNYQELRSQQRFFDLDSKRTI